MINQLSTAPLVVFFITSLLISCSKGHDNKDSNSGNPCDSLALLHIDSVAPVTKGDEIRISIGSLEGANYEWTGPNNFGSNDQNPLVSSSSDYSNRGWYYVNISLAECSTRIDSVYVNVKFPQGSPPCSLINNKATFDGAVLLGDQAYSYVSFGAGMSGYEITGNSSNGDLKIAMSTYWETHTIEDGIYYTTGSPLPSDEGIDKIFISDVNQSIYWTADANNPVYISHVGGKVRLSFCNIFFSGDWRGKLYKTTVNAQISQP